VVVGLEWNRTSLYVLFSERTKQAPDDRRQSLRRKRFAREGGGKPFFRNAGIDITTG
jgi:hypothetical protein